MAAADRAFDRGTRKGVRSIRTIGEDFRDQRLSLGFWGSPAFYLRNTEGINATSSESDYSSAPSVRPAVAIANYYGKTESRFFVQLLF